VSLTDAQYAYLRSELGEADRADLDARFQRLGSLQGVAIEVLRERKAALVSDPLAVTVQGVATVNNAENVRALERQIATLEGQVPDDGAYTVPVPIHRTRSR
jgi:Fe2+ transport system protein FeoA